LCVRVFRLSSHATKVHRPQLQRTFVHSENRGRLLLLCDALECHISLPSTQSWVIWCLAEITSFRLEQECLGA
jgi:hypothetical protein